MRALAPATHGPTEGTRESHARLWTGEVFATGRCRRSVDGVAGILADLGGTGSGTGWTWKKHGKNTCRMMGYTFMSERNTMVYGIEPTAKWGVSPTKVEILAIFYRESWTIVLERSLVMREPINQTYPRWRI